MEDDLPSLDEILHFLRPLDTAFGVVVQLRYRALDDDLQQVDRTEVRWIREFVVRELEERKTRRPNVRSNRIWSTFDAFRLLTCKKIKRAAQKKSSSVNERKERKKRKRKQNIQPCSMPCP